MSNLHKKKFSERIKENYFHMIEEYKGREKSDHWKNYFDKNFKNKIEKFNLSEFRKKNLFSKRLTAGMEDVFGFYDTLSPLINFISENNKQDLVDLSDISVGKPNFYNFNGIKTNYNEIFIIRQMITIYNSLNKNHKYICEIGGGFGSLASKLKKKINDSTIILIDLPESLILQTYYLNQIYPNSKFCLYDDFLKLNNQQLNKLDYDFVLIPPWVKNKLVGNLEIDCFINSHSFQEMDKDVVNDYFNFIQKTIAINGIFYCLNKYSKLINKIDIKISEYPYDSNWKVLKSNAGWQQPNMHEIITVRESVKSNEISNLLKGLKKGNPSVLNLNLKTYIKIFIRKILNIFMFFVPKKIIFQLFKIYY